MSVINDKRTTIIVSNTKDELKLSMMRMEMKIVRVFPFALLIAHKLYYFVDTIYYFV